jgi:thymidylate synthase (FAD)
MKLRDDVTVELVRASATDNDVIASARVSTIGEQAEHGRDQDASTGLINYLMRDRHGTPFEHNSMTFLVSAPIFVFREFHRHRVGWSYNEESARYREMRPTFYVPAAGRPLAQQGKPGAYQFTQGTPAQHDNMRRELHAAYAEAWRAYQQMIGAGVAREIARACLPVGIYSSMYATCNARSLMHFLSLRTKRENAKIPSFPQHEIQLVADAMEAYWAELMPATHAAFEQHGRVAP